MHIKKMIQELHVHESKTALENNEFELYYQPQFHLRTAKIIGVEALIRWNHPLLGFLSPDQFIPQAEDTGFIHQLGQWVLEEACRQVKLWRDQGFSLNRVAVNLSSLQIYQKNFFEIIKETIEKLDIQPHILELEITENIFMKNTEDVIETLHKIKSLGVKIALDDFGTGYSSLSYLRHFPVDRIKIDGSFLKDINENVINGVILRSIIELANNLNIHVIAEGIELEEHVEVLKEMKCNEGQGYFFSKPVPACELEKILKRDGEIIGKG